MPDADVLEALALDVTACLVAGERIERPAAERHLATPVGPVDGGEAWRSGRLDALANDERMPEGKAKEQSLALEPSGAERDDERAILEKVYRERGCSG